MYEKTGFIDTINGQGDGIDKGTGIIVKMIAFAITMLALQGCAQQNVKEALDNISHDCARHYTFSASTGGVGGIGGSITLAGTADCKPSGAPADPVVTPAPAPAQ